MEKERKIEKEKKNPRSPNNNVLISNGAKGLEGSSRHKSFVGFHKVFLRMFFTFMTFLK